MTSQALGLLCGFLVAHYLGDFSPLATPRMHEAKADGGPLSVIAAHALVHALLVAIVVILFSAPVSPAAATAAGVVFVTHFALDLTRSRLGSRFAALKDPGQNVFWYLLGLDQLAHLLILVALAAWIMR
ncbi:MAG: DUF3307 domain-containing protein [Gemmatimonadetes bacterium]|nr:DUF3307 domain-containing protein [Gemmatimonadota bacterium]NIO30851.1 DUF3307 domain-containing protein [Gemmatimonadota bacterium]